MTTTLLNGDTIIFNNATKETWQIVSQFTTDQEVIDYYFSTQQEIIPESLKGKEQVKVAKEKEIVEAKKTVEVQKKKIEAINSGYKSLINTGDFEVNDGVVMMKGINLSIPEMLVEKFIEVVNTDSYHGLCNFWKWCSICPNPQSREDLFKYLQIQGLSINRNGFFFAYRKIQSVCKSKSAPNKAFVEFVSASYLKIKSQKKSPKNFDVCIGIDLPYILKPIGVESTKFGNLFDLYQNLGNDTVQEQMFTDAHTNSYDIRIGKPVSLPPDQCNWNNGVDCGSGLHIGSRDFGCGDTSILVLVNPMHSVSVPVSNGHKMRVSQYFPIAILPSDHTFDIHKNEDLLDLCDEYFNDELQRLNDMVANNKPTELVKHKLILDTSAIDLINKLEFEIPDATQVIASRTIDYSKPSNKASVVDDYVYEYDEDEDEDYDEEE